MWKSFNANKYATHSHLFWNEKVIVEHWMWLNSKWFATELLVVMFHFCSVSVSLPRFAGMIVGTAVHRHIHKCCELLHDLAWIATKTAATAKEWRRRKTHSTLKILTHYWFHVKVWRNIYKFFFCTLALSHDTIGGSVCHAMCVCVWVCIYVSRPFACACEQSSIFYFLFSMWHACIQLGTPLKC